jgi:hypothetical protein
LKRLFKISTIVILLFGTAIYLPSCKKEATLPNVTTIPVSNITQTTAATGGTSRSYAVGFSIGNKGYLGTGSLLKDFWDGIKRLMYGHRKPILEDPPETELSVFQSGTKDI